MFETIINGLSDVENGGIETKMNILALLVSEIVILPMLGGFGTNFGAPRIQFLGN